MFQDFENNIINFFNDLINYDTHCCSNEALSFITCTMSAKRLSGKRKLSAVEAENVDHPPTMATRRTRSSSVAENCNTQRSTRSANKNSFVQLPHNYRYSSRKVVQESNEASPLKRSKRSSTSSSSNHVTENGVLPSPPKKKKLQNNTVSSLITASLGKENLLTCNGKTDKAENLKESIEKRSKNEYMNCGKNSKKEQKLSTVPEINQTLDCSCDNDEKAAKVSAADCDLKVCSKLKTETSLQTYMRKNLPIPLCQLEDFKRKRHFSENEISSSGRIRRLSERGEMASVMEFFFKNKKPLSTSFVSSKKTKQLTKRSLRNSDQKRTKLKDQLDCNVVARIKKTRRMSGSHSNSVLSNCDSDKSNLPPKKEVRISEEIETKHKAIPNYIKAGKNGLPDEKIFNELLEEVGITQSQDHPLKRSLRSSGVRCQPDYYELGLNLMIRRRSRISTDNFDKSDLQVMSDSEIDMNKKSPIESCIAHEELEQKHKSIEDSQSMQDKEQLEHKTEATQTPSNTSSKTKTKKLDNDLPPNSIAKRDLPTPTEPSEPPPLFDEEPPSGPEVYFFESDHAALKHNADYYSLLRSASVLESQRKQALADLDQLQESLKKALKDPIAFVDQLQKKESVDLPRDLSISALPTIDWSKYTSPFGTFENVFGPEPSKPTTRGKKSTFTTLQKSSDQPSAPSTKNRSQTFKKSWTVEEQRKLEELLVKYPQEAVEFRRYRKIASELDGRTALQVQSRVQKYFLKLAKAGLPIPGRMPRLDRWISCKGKMTQRTKHRTHHQAALTRISTFFSDFHLPVKMSDSDADLPAANEDDGGWDALKSEQVSDEEDIPDDLRFSDEYLEILKLKRQRRQRLRVFDRSGRQAIAKHVGYQCDMCETEPIEGVRYHCIDCPDADGVDLCQSCIRMKTKFETSVHKSNHRMEPVYANIEFDGSNIQSIPSTSRPYTDSDYTKVVRSSGEYNYLDPNFLPPTG